MEQKCDKEGYRWCPVMKKCMPPDHFKGKGRGMQKGQGKGPMGNPVKEAEGLVDLAFDEGFEIFGKATKAMKKVDKILDAVKEVDLGKGTMTSRPYDHPKKIRVVADVEECDMMDDEDRDRDEDDMMSPEDDALFEELIRKHRTARHQKMKQLLE